MLRGQVLADHPARGHQGRRRRLPGLGPAGGAHPRVLAALAAGQLSESVARTICDWTGQLPQDCQDSADAILVAAALSGASLADLARLAAEIYARSRPPDPDGPDDGFDDRSVRLETTFEGAGVLGGDLTPECAAVVTAVLDALSAPAGPGTCGPTGSGTTTPCRTRCSACSAPGCCRGGPGNRSGPGLTCRCAELLALDGDGMLLGQWVTAVRAQWAGNRAAASVAGSDGAAWLDGAAAAAVACDALISPVVTGEVDPSALDDLVRLCVELSRWNDQDPGEADADRERPPQPPRRPGRPPRPVRRSNAPSSARPWSCCPARAGWHPSCAASSSAPRWPGPASRWTSATATPSRPPSGTPSPCATSTAGGPAGAASPPPPARSTTSATWPTAAPPA